MARLEAFRQTAGTRLEDEEDLELETKQDDESLELLTFEIGGEAFSIDVEMVEEIITPRRSTRVPNAPPEIIGIFSLRGRIVTLIDLAKILDVDDQWNETLDSRLIVVRVASDTLGFRVDRVMRVARINPESIQPQPVVSGTERNVMTAGVVRLDGTMISVLSADKLAG